MFDGFSGMIADDATQGADNEADDQALALSARHDSAAFGMLYRRHLNRVYRYFVTYMGDSYLAQDLTAQTFLAALESIASYRGQGSFRAWLLSIARNKAIDSIRRRQLTIPLESAAQTPSSQPGPEQVVAARLELEQVLQAMRALSPERSEALALRLFGGLRISEIASIMEKNEAAVKMLVHRAIHDLRDRLNFIEEEAL